MDKFTYTTTYKQEFCVKHFLPGSRNDFPVNEPAEEINADCRGIFIPGIATGLPPDPKVLGTCPCQAGGLLPPRGAIAKGLPTNLDKKCICFTCGNCSRPPIKTKVSQGDPKKRISRQIECRKQSPDTNAVRKNVEVRPFSPNGKIHIEKLNSPCSSFKGIRPIARGKQPPRRNQGNERCNGPPWLNPRRDVRRNPDVFRINRNPPRGEVPDVIHGEEARARGGRRPTYEHQGGRRRVNASRSDVRIPGPFWIRRRPDERREIECPRKRKFETPTEARDVIHGGSNSSRVGGRPSDFRYPRRRPGPNAGGSAIPGPFWNRERPDERREVDVLRKRKFVTDYEAREVIHGEGSGGGNRRRHPLDLPSKCRPPSDSRIPGPFWMRDRPDMRREPDMARRRRIEVQGEVPDVIHGEERRAREWREAKDRRAEERRQIDPYDLPPGPSHADPFWLLERADERRNPDMDRKRKFERQVIKAAEIIHGEDFRARYDPPRRDELPRVLGPDPEDEVIESDEEEGESFPFRRACECAPGPAESGPDRWMMQHDWGDARPGRAPMGPDMEETIRDFPPAARISCAPQADVANFDQPNAFMRQLYQKYPYLYQVLRETPPEELASRVFKDKFLSTYQVDYLHMGVGQEKIPEGGALVQERMTGPDGEPEPQVIPGCSFRHGEKGDFGRKKQEENKREKDTPPEEEVREEPRISEYMATISRLGNEIVTDQLYRVAQITKNMKNQYKKT